MKEFSKYIESELEQLIDGLKDNIKKKVCFGSTQSGDINIYGTCNNLVTPPKIEVNINSIEKILRPQIIKVLKEILSHEIIHAIQTPATMEDWQFKENEAYYKQNKVNFWK